jgi:hypothetical protein
MMPPRAARVPVRIEWTTGFAFAGMLHARRNVSYYEELIDQVYADDRAWSVKYLRDLIINGIPSC